MSTESDGISSTINVVLKPDEDSQPEIEVQVRLTHTGSLSFFGTEPKDNSIECVVFED
jgi:hypothetical protein